MNTPEGWSARAELVDPYEAVGWSKQGQEERFDAVLAALDPQPEKMLLDYGCGTGAFSELVPERVLYYGYDWSPGMVARARREHPDRNFFSRCPGYGFDYIACIGTFNVPGDKQTTWNRLHKLWDYCEGTMAVSLYAGEDPRNLSYDEDEVGTFAISLGVIPELSRPRENDLLLVMRR